MGLTAASSAKRYLFGLNQDGVSSTRSRVWRTTSRAWGGLRLAVCGIAGAGGAHPQCEARSVT